MPSRYRCRACGNLTRFDVVVTRRSAEYHHFTVGGELDVEQSEVVEERVESVRCRWCGAEGPTVESVETAGDAGAPPA